MSDDSVTLMAVYRWGGRPQEWGQAIGLDRETDTLRLFDPRTHEEWTVPLSTFEDDISDGSITECRLKAVPTRAEESEA